MSDEGGPGPLGIPAGSSVSAGEGVTGTHSRRWPTGAVRLSIWIILACLLALSAAAWVLSARQAAGHSMATGIVPLAGSGMREAAGIGHGQMEMGSGAAAMTTSVFLAMWVTMMVAMMFPAVAPAVIAHSKIAARRGESALSVPVFTGSYLAVWAATGVLAYLVYRLILATVPAMPTRTVGLVAAAALAVAGAYQLTPLKWACLKACRSPLLQFFSWRPGLGGALRMGTRHGLTCLGCCWALMLVLFVVGLMSLVWMGMLAAVIFVEKVLPFGARTAKPLGVALIALGAVVAAWPGVLL